MTFQLKSKTLENLARGSQDDQGGRDVLPIGPLNARILMCPPRHFGVDYIINPWMVNQVGRADVARAHNQWDNLRRHLAASANVTFIAPAPGLPDMAFTANAGLALDGIVVVSRFHANERRPEEKWFRQWFERQGFCVAPWPDNLAFEGAGDALPDREKRLIWCGFGWRSSKLAPALLENIFSRRTVGLKLIDPRFYHLDTCFCPLSGGWLLYYPSAFDQTSLRAIHALIPMEKRIEVGEADALSFACNAVEIGGRIFLNDCSVALRSRLTDAGFAPVVVALSEFLKAGGAAKCLTLELDQNRST